MQNIFNPLTLTEQWKNGVKTYKENLLKYQPGPNWYFGSIEEGRKWNEATSTHDGVMTMEDLENLIKGVSPIGPKVPIEEVENVTFSWNQLCEKFPSHDNDENQWSNHFDYQKYSEWLSEQSDIFYYARGREDFYQNEAYEIASNLGYRKLILEDLS